MLRLETPVLGSIVPLPSLANVFSSLRNREYFDAEDDPRRAPRQRKL